MLTKLKWLTFQFVVAMATFVWIGTWADITKYGIAPAVMSMFVAFIATALLSRLIDWRASRRFRVGNEPQREGSGFLAIGRRPRDLPKKVARPWIGQDIRKLP